MKLAGGHIEPGGMTANGEVMVDPSKQYSTSTARWIVPDGRLTTELGIRITKCAGRVILDKGPLEKKPIEAVNINRLPYLTWKDFGPLRDLLANSHRKGRIPWHGEKTNNGID